MNFVKNLFKNILAFCISIIIGLLIGEFIIRVFFPQVTSPVQFFYDAELGGMIPVPNQKGFKNHPNVYHYDYQNNEIGMRDTRQLADYEKIPFKILCVGDSFTYGWGVNDDETFCNVLEKKIKNDTVAVLNAGASGAGTDYALKFFKVRSKVLSPKVVIYFYFENDKDDNQENRYFTISNDSILTNDTNKFTTINAIKKNQLIDSKIYNWLSSNSHLFSLLRFQVGVFWNNKVKKENESKNSIKNSQNTVNKKTQEKIATSETKPLKHDSVKNPYYSTFTYLKALASEVNHKGAKFYTFYIPSHESILEYKKSGGMKQEDSLRSFCHKNQINFYSFKQTLFRNKDPYHAYYFPVDFHWNKYGHKAAGEYIYEVLKKDKMVD